MRNVFLMGWNPQQFILINTSKSGQKIDESVTQNFEHTM